MATVAMHNVGIHGGAWHGALFVFTHHPEDAQPGPGVTFLHIAPVPLGDGIRLFDNPGGRARPAGAAHRAGPQGRGRRAVPADDRRSATAHPDQPRKSTELTYNPYVTPRVS